MNIVNETAYETIKVRRQDSVCFLEIARPEANNTINKQLIVDLSEALSECEEWATVVVLSGSPEVFCYGADFKAMARMDPMLTIRDRHGEEENDTPGLMYDLWLRMATGPYVTIAHVRGQANAGGVGFVAASDIVLADESAQFSLSELIFGLYPACVLPFLIRRVGFQKAHYLTLSTAPIGAKQAMEWGLVDAVEPQSEVLLRRHLQRLRRLSKSGIRRYKSYASRISMPLRDLKSTAVAGNLELFTDQANRQAITRFVERGVFPWEP